MSKKRPTRARQGPLTLSKRNKSTPERGKPTTQVAKPLSGGAAISRSERSLSSTRQATIAIADMEARLIDLDAQIEGGVAARRNMSTLDAVKSIYHASLRIDSTQRLLEAKAVEMRDQVASSLTILEAYKDFAQVLRQIGLGLETEMKGMKASDRDGVERAQRELERGDGAQVFTQHGFAEPALSWNAQDLLDNFDVVTAEDMDPKRILN